MADIYVRSTDGSDADNGSTWALAKATLTGALAIATNADTIWVSDAHAESTAGSVTLTCPATPGLRIICGDDAAEPPTTLTTTGSVSVGASSAVLTISGNAYIYGVKLQGGTNNSGTCDIQVGTTATQLLEFESCVFDIRTANSGGAFIVGPTIGTGVSPSIYIFKNCTYKFGHTSQGIEFGFGNTEFINMALDAAGSAPSTLFKNTSAGNGSGSVLVSASDLTGKTWTNLLNISNLRNFKMVVHACKLPASWTTVTGTWTVGSELYLLDCHSGDTHGYFEYHNLYGNILRNASVYYTGGASGSMSWQVNTSSSAKFTAPFITPWIDPYNIDTSAVAPYIEVLRNNSSTTAWNDDEIWIEVEAKVTANVTTGTVSNDKRGQVTAAAAQDTGAGAGSWTGESGSCWFGKLAVASLTPTEGGYIRARVHFAVASNSSLYIDPQIRT